ncbi:hypothetical protein [Dokdonella sp.]|uniref:hypothetical protein n=1 Tax=Dokdonella sp. TaxID=2291710 RepID=UPI0037847131
MHACAVHARPVLLALAGMLATQVAAAGSVPAAPFAFGSGTSQLTVTTTNIVLDPIRLDDIADRAIQPLAPETRRAVAIGGRLVSAGTINVPPVRLTVTRHLHQAWRMQVPQGRSMASTGVSARVESMAGPNALSSDEKPGASLPVRVIPQPPRIVASDARSQTLEGDVLLEFDLRTLRAAGSYSGRLIITAEGT